MTKNKESITTPVISKSSDRWQAHFAMAYRKQTERQGVLRVESPLAELILLRKECS